jgi:hypothetical protein
VAVRAKEQEKQADVQTECNEHVPFCSRDLDQRPVDCAIRSGTKLQRKKKNRKNPEQGKNDVRQRPMRSELVKRTPHPARSIGF